MESIYTDLALYGSKNYCAGTDTVFLTISEVCDGTASLPNTEVQCEKEIQYVNHIQKKIKL